MGIGDSHLHHTTYGFDFCRRTTQWGLATHYVKAGIVFKYNRRRTTQWGLATYSSFRTVLLKPLQVGELPNGDWRLRKPPVYLRDENKGRRTTQWGLATSSLRSSASFWSTLSENYPMGIGDPLRKSGYSFQIQSSENYPMGIGDIFKLSDGFAETITSRRTTQWGLATQEATSLPEG